MIRMLPLEVQLHFHRLHRSASVVTNREVPSGLGREGAAEVKGDEGPDSTEADDENDDEDVVDDSVGEGVTIGELGELPALGV